jgi:hypothetical protein
MQKPEEMHARRIGCPKRLVLPGSSSRRGKPPLSQPNCIYRLGQPCWFLCGSRLVAGYDVSQFSSVLLLVTALTLTVCVGVAAWRISGDTSEVTGGIPPSLIDQR